MKSLFKIKTIFYIFTWTILAASVFLLFERKSIHQFSSEEGSTSMLDQNELFYLQRSCADSLFSWKAYAENMRIVQALVDQKKFTRQTNSSFNSQWLLEGPSNIGGRINTVLIHPQDINIIYAGCASGGIFKTTNGGLSWTPIFDSHSYLAIGKLVFDPSNPNIIYAGTGDPNISSYPFLGDGLYKSTDAGATWTHLGLSSSCIIADIEINPLNTAEMYVATMGIPFYKGNDRGLYKSTDGGQSWNNILFLSDSAGIIDIVMNPQDPNMLYAVGMNRIRNNSVSVAHGPDAGIYKTSNGGMNWTKLSGGLPMGNYSRISLAMSFQNPNLLYACYTDSIIAFLGMYKSTDAGSTWNQIVTSGLTDPFRDFGWYFGKLAVNPANDNELLLGGVDLHKSLDGGQNWFLGAPDWWTYDVHADKHDIVYYSPTTIFLATDGGLYQTHDGGIIWADIDEIPNNQFYRVTYSPYFPGIYNGGLQDNGTVENSASHIAPWQRLYGGDGFTMIYHPFDPNIIYFETQRGGIVVSVFGFDADATMGIDTTEERNWDMPYIMSSSNPNILYTGTTRMYKNYTGESTFWQPISGELIDQGFSNASRFHTISCIAESKVNTDRLYAGTSDGNVWTSPDAGNSWSNITGTLPDQYVTCIKASEINPALVYVSHSGYRDNDFIPHLHKTSNGNTWIDISGDLPQISVNCILTYPLSDDILLVGTDGGVYVTLNGGIHWERVGNNMPVIPVYDMAYQPVERKILAGTHGRSMMSYSMDSLVNEIDEPLSILFNYLKISPNPATNKITLTLDYLLDPNSSIEIISADGQQLKKIYPTVEMEIPIQIDDLADGIYFLRINSGNIHRTKKFIKIGVE